MSEEINIKTWRLVLDENLVGGSVKHKPKKSGLTPQVYGNYWWEAMYKISGDGCGHMAGAITIYDITVTVVLVGSYTVPYIVCQLTY